MNYYTKYIEQYNANPGLYGSVPLWKKVWLIIIIFLYFYNIPLNGFGIPFSSSKVVMMISIVNLFLHPHYIPQLFTNRYYRHYNKVIFLLLAYILLYSFFVHFTFFEGYNYPYVIILFTFDCFLGGFYIVKCLSNYNVRTLINLAIVVVVIQAMIMIVAIVYNPLRLFIFETLKSWDGNMGQDLNLNAMKFRGLALASDRKLGIAVLNGIICNLIIYLSLTLKQKGSRRALSYTLYGVAFILTFISGMLAARTFYVVFSFVFVGLMLRSKYNIVKVAKFLLFSLLIVFTLGAGVLGSVADNDTMEKVEAFADWTFEAYNKYEETGELKTGSSDDLLDNHWQFTPQDTYSWWFGGPDRTSRGGEVVLTEFSDSGYLLMLYYGGILGCLAIYAFWPFIAWRASKLYLKKERLSTLIVVVVILFYLLEIKYQAILGSYTVVKMLLLLYILGAERLTFFKNLYLNDEANKEAGKVAA
ncbi:hypothetical protein [Taibaiella chishuiensis]|uniref:O-antigen ligase-like membrane protein n=1 Tax=Taibaiella chishuiensis TaxID=1434707 RepID=A0A2P8DB79_9BACT|nr:hypothetical protein [Taibaiella chishuiensis]PSK94461.1 hypothetical protein B0I18_101617 [Taibaiella chishuiensis]